MRKRPASHLDSAQRLRYEEASLEALRKQVCEKEQLVHALRKEVYGRRRMDSAIELPSGRFYVRKNFVDWTIAQVEEAIEKKEGHRDRKRMRFLRKCWKSDLARDGAWGSLSIGMCPLLQGRLPLEIALIDLVGYSCVRWWSGFGATDTDARQELRESIRLVGRADNLPSWLYYVPVWMQARNPWGDYTRTMEANPRYGRKRPLEDHTSHIAAVSKVWTHSVAKVRLDEKGNIVECDRLTKAFIDTIG